jgi:excisionase family DNA binding protein
MADPKKQKSTPELDPPVVVDPNIAKRWLSVDEAAGYMHVSTSTVRSLIHRGEIRASRSGRGYLLDLADLDALLERRKKIQAPYKRNSHPWVSKRRANFRRKKAMRRKTTKHNLKGDQEWKKHNN